MHLLPFWALALIVVSGFGSIWWLIHRFFVKPKQTQVLRSKTEKSRRTAHDVEQALSQLPQKSSPDFQVVKRTDPAEATAESDETAAIAEKAMSTLSKNGKASSN